jgi:Tol biopolymer transport system component
VVTGRNNDSLRRKPSTVTRNIYSIRPDGTGLTQITHYTGGAMAARVDSWSPDGKQIVFHVRPLNPSTSGINQLFVMNKDGTEIQQLTHLPRGTNPERAAWGSA